MRIIDAFAPAKINLTLHVIGQRADGYHLLDSLVAFGPMGDRLVLRESDALSLSVAGPEAAGVPADPSNLVLKAAALLSRPAGQGAETHLDKYLPPASGIGGGSSDAAAALRALAALWDHPLPAETAQLGADVPMCLTPRPQRVRGIGEALDLVSLPPLPALLVNPRVEVPTPAIFKGLDSKDNPPMPEVLPTFTGAPDCIDWLATQRNDLQAPAIASAPVIGEVLDALMTLPGCRLARMSGSGATCFALFETLDAAQAAEATLAQRRPRWWRASGMLGDQTQKAQPHSRASSS